MDNPIIAAAREARSFIPRGIATLILAGADAALVSLASRDALRGLQRAAPEDPHRSQPQTIRAGAA
jgi:hypothetical protein